MELEKQDSWKKCSLIPQLICVCAVLLTFMGLSYWIIHSINSEMPAAVVQPIQSQGQSRHGILADELSASSSLSSTSTSTSTSSPSLSVSSSTLSFLNADTIEEELELLAIEEERRKKLFDDAWNESMNTALNIVRDTVTSFSQCYSKRQVRITTALMRWFTCTFVGNVPRSCTRAFVLTFSPCFDPNLSQVEQNQLVDEFLEIIDSFHRSSGDFISSVVPYSTCFLLHQREIFQGAMDCARLQIPQDKNESKLPSVCNALDTVTTCLIGGYQRNCDSIAVSFAKTFVHGDATRNWSRKYIWRCPQRNITTQDFTISS